MFTGKRLLKPVLFLTIWGLLVLLSWNMKKWRIGDLLYSDTEGYYMYLPAMFLNNGFENLFINTPAAFKNYGNSNLIFTKYTCGVAILQSPFFIVTDTIYNLSGNDKECGYAYGYFLSVIAAGCFYLTVGIWLLGKLLAKRFGYWAAGAAIVCTFFGTNLYFYSISQPGMSHIYSFFLFAALVYFTPRLYYNTSAFYWILSGIVMGMIVLIRPINCIIVLYPLLYGVVTWQTFNERVRHLYYRLPYILPAAIAGLLVFVPQLLYWKYISGHFVLYSYNTETFEHWANPKILKVLFDVQNGWLLYSPMMVLALAGIILLYRQKTVDWPAIALALCIATYLFASWWAWWFGGAFGHRCYVEYYAILVIPFAAYFVWLQHRVVAVRVLSALFIVAAGYYNVKLTYLYAPPWDGSSWNWDVFGNILKQLL